MSDEHKFWILVWPSAFLGLSLFVGTLCHFSLKQDVIIAEAVKAGADPLALRCGLSDSYGDNPSCILIANKE